MKAKEIKEVDIDEKLRCIELLSELRSNYDCFEENEEPYYRALSVGIKVIREQISDSQEGRKKNLCDSCENPSCIFQSGIVRNHCDFYKAGSEEEVAKAFQLGVAFGFGKRYDEMDKVIEEIKKIITPQKKSEG